jgi:transcriptional regulator with XRE-family HTH domain
MRFGETIRALRAKRNLSQRELAAMVDVTFTYISKIENHKLDFGEYPSEAMIHKLAESLDADETELLLLAEKVPPRIRQRVMERPEAFSKIAELDDETLDKFVAQIDRRKVRKTSC